MARKLAPEKFVLRRRDRKVFTWNLEQEKSRDFHEKFMGLCDKKGNLLEASEQLLAGQDDIDEVTGKIEDMNKSQLFKVGEKEGISLPQSANRDELILRIKGGRELVAEPA